MNGDGIGHKFNHGRAARSYENVVGFKPEGETSLLPYLLKARHELNSDHLLSAVVVCLDDYWLEVVGLERFVV